MVYPEKSEGVGGLGFDEMDLLQSATDLHAKTLKENTLKYGKTSTYFIPLVNLKVLGPTNFPYPVWIQVKFCCFLQRD